MIKISAYKIRSFACCRHSGNSHIKAVVILAGSIYRSIRSGQSRKRGVLVCIIAGQSYRPVIKQSHTSGGNFRGIGRTILREDFRINQSFRIQLMHPFQRFAGIVLYKSIIHLFLIGYHIMIHIIAAAKRSHCDTGVLVYLIDPEGHGNDLSVFHLNIACESLQNRF